MRHDVSPRPRAGDDRFSRFVDHAADGVFLVAKGGRIVDVNAEGCRMLRYTSEELLELKVLDVQQSLDAEAFDELWESTLPGEPVTVESEARRKDGSLFPVEVRVARLWSDGEELMLALVRDVTARKEAEAAHAGKTLEDGRPVIVADLTAAGYSASTLLHEHGVTSTSSKPWPTCSAQQ
jgi:PAS domain S-box-containing protein